MLKKLWPFKRNPELEKWRSQLTLELKVHFKNVGYELVQRDIYVYKSLDKRDAALAWLHARRVRRAVITGLTVLGTTIAAIAAGFGVYSEIQDQKAARHNQAWSLVAQGASTRANIGLKNALETLHNDGVALKRVRLPRAWLEGVQLPGADLRWSILHIAQLNAANLSGANLSEVFLMGADLQNADLRRASLAGAHLTGAHFRKANLSGADISGADFTQANNLTQEQISSACADAVRLPILPVGIEPPPPCAK